MSGWRLQIKNLALLFVLLTGNEVSIPAHTQNNAWHLTRFSTINGLASPDISTLFQDSDHFLWIGHTAGVTRYDGYTWENLLFAGAHRLGKVYAILEDGEQTVWIGAEGGLFFYTQNKLNYADHIFTNTSVYAIALHKNHSLWIGTDRGVALIELKEMKEPTRKKENSLSVSTSRSRLGSLQDKKIKFISAASGEAVFFCDGYKTWRLYNHELVLIDTTRSSRDYITGLVAVNNETIYLSSQLSGFRMVGKNGSQAYKFSKGIGNALTGDSTQLLYFASEGIYAFDPKVDSVTHQVALPKQYQEWGSCVLLDKENNFWIGTHEELLQARSILFSRIDQPHIEGFAELYSLYEDDEGALFAGGNRGRLFRQEGNGMVPDFSLWKTVFPLAEVFDMYQAKNGDRWFCSGYEGISLLRNGNLQRYTTKDGILSNGNYKFIATGKYLFVCGQDGVTAISYGARDSVYFRNYKTSREPGQNITLTDGVANSDGSLLLGTDRGFLEWKNDSLYNITLLNTQRRNPSITSIARDKAGDVWVSTIGDGILVCTKNGDNWELKKQFGENDGLSSLIYLQLMVDKNDIVWATGYKDITRIEEKTANKFFITTYGQDHGFTDNSFHSVKMKQDKKGIAWIATSSGLMCFDPATIQPNYSPPACKITGISFFHNKETGTVPGVGTSKEPKLPYRKGSLSFHYSGIHLSNPATVQYAYRLLGADSNWTMIGGERTVNFQNLSPGNYTFQVRASLDNTIWGNTQSYSFMVEQPFWQRWWFVALSILVLAMAGRSFMKAREKNIKKREAEKTELELVKATSLQHQLEIEQIINFFAASMNEQKNIDTLLWNVTKNCISKLGFEDCVIYLKDKSRNTLIQKAAWGPKTNENNKITNPIEVPLGCGIVGSVALSGKPEIIADTTLDKRYIVDDIRRGSEISVPIIDDKEIIGVIDSEHPQKGFYTDRHLQVLSTIASLVADKIDKIKAEQQTREKEMELLKLNKDLAISQLTALRAQMNPHFIFNALNSVQQYILQGNVVEANKYLSRFSKLQREILHHCDQNFIFLEKEIEMLDLYLQLEQLRFNDLFTYHIYLDDAVDGSEIMIPPMILQPFVENAIWHGLMPKQDKRKLDIRFSLPSDDILLCTIQDNGIGREAASRLQQSVGQGNHHKSKGLSLVYERLNILRQQYQQQFEVSITDSYDTMGNPAGTLVTLTIFAGH